MLKITKLIILVTLFVTLINCSDPSNNIERFDLVVSESPIDLSEVNAKFYKDISYGESKENSFDLFLPDSEDKTPLVIFVHGGGFVGGDKDKAYKGQYPENIRSFLRNNIAFATINYRFISDAKSNGVITSLNDSKRCLQFIRYHSQELNINKDLIGMYGSSAGSGISLWLGLHDDMKDPKSEDLIGRESTRIKAVGALETQATFDIVKWGSIVFKTFGLTFEKLTKLGLNKTILLFYNVESIEELFEEQMIEYRKRIDFLELMSVDDPPIWVNNKKYEASIPRSKKDLNHHPFHAKVLKERADKIGLESLFYIPKLGIIDSSGLDLTEFMIQKLN